MADYVVDDAVNRVWNHAGDCGCFSDTPYHFRSAFDVFILEGDSLYYRLLPVKERKPPQVPADSPYGKSLFFDGIILHDPIECFVSEKLETPYRGKRIYRTCIDEDCEVMETERSFPYSVYETYVAAAGSKTMGQICQDEQESEQKKQKTEK